jgi:hypothetical protein
MTFKLHKKKDKIMCLAIFKPQNKMIPDEMTLRRAWKNNPHGAGVAIRTIDGVQIIKGLMTIDSLLNVLNDSLIGFDLVIHFRWATSGNVNAEMTHPFPVSNDNNDLKSLDLLTDTAIIHNGVMFSPRFDSGYSDTAIFSRYLAINGINYSKIQEIIGYDRLAIVTQDDVELIGQWNEIDGVFYSNLYSIADEIESKWAYRDNLKDPYFHSSDDWAFYDSRNYFEDEDLEFCPCCSSDEIEHIGLKSLTFECLECGVVFNESHFLESNFIEQPKNKNKKVRAG